METPIAFVLNKNPTKSVSLECYLKNRFSSFGDKNRKPYNDALRGNAYWNLSRIF
mgnify:CR=1 FL=1